MNKQTLVFAGAFIAILFVLGIIAASLAVMFSVKDSGAAAPKQKTHGSETETLDTPKLKNSQDTLSVPAKDPNHSKIVSVSLETSYTGFFDERSKCRKSYNELFGKSEGFFSKNSACTEKISFSSSGEAERILEVKRFDKTTRKKVTKEKSVWKAQISQEKFLALANYLAKQDVFKNFREVDVYASNTSITIKRENKTMNFQSNVDEKTSNALEMMEAFKKVEVEWEKVQ